MDWILKDGKVEVNTKEIVQVVIHEIGTLVGTVEAITQDYLFLKNIVVIEPVNESTLILDGFMLFYRDEIEQISVIATSSDSTPLLQMAN